MRPNPHYYNRNRSKGRFYSALVHALLLLLAMYGLPYFMSSHPLEEPMAISVEILPITQVSNVKPSPEPPAEEPKPAEKKPTPKEAPPVKTAEAPPPPPPPEPKPTPKPPESKPLPKPPEPKPPEPKKEKPKPKEDDLAAVLKAVKDTAQKEKNAEKKTQEAKDTSASKSRSNSYNANLPLSMSEIDAIRNQIAKCWVPPIGAKDAQNLAVKLMLEIAPDGSVLKVELADESRSRYNSDSFFRAAADSARRAVQECSPLKNLPPEKYQTWRDMEMTFDPKEMLF